MKLLEKIPVEQYAHRVSTTPIVSVCIQTYNHVNYIKKCLDSVLTQQTDYEFEILLGEDASNDGTREVCVEYAQKYPDKIRLFLHHRENNIYIGGNPTGRFNLLYNFSKTRGKYIAICEGDDYWTDSSKLQKQVSKFLATSDLSLIFTNANKLVNGEIVPFFLKATPPEQMTSEEFIIGHHQVPTCSTMLSRGAIDEILKCYQKWETHFFHMDYFMWTIASKVGDVYFINEYMVTYLVHAESIIRKANTRMALKNGIRLNNILSKEFSGKTRTYFQSGKWWYYLEFAFLEIKSNNFLKAHYWLVSSLIDSIFNRKTNQFQIIRDFGYRLRNRSIN